MIQNIWPDDYPTHLIIPPEDAKPINAQLYRFVKNTTPTADDFLPSYKDPKQKHLIKYDKFKNNPSFYGTSFFSSENAIKRKKEESPEKFKDEQIAKGDIAHNHGLAQFGKSHHVSVWFYVGQFPNGFQVI